MQPVAFQKENFAASCRRRGVAALTIRTPLAHALVLARPYLTPSTLLIVLTDGRANAGLGIGDPWQEALQVASELRCRGLVIDTGTGAPLHGRSV